MSAPEVRARLREIAADQATPAHLRRELTSLADDLGRAPPIRRAPITSRRITAELRREIAAHIRSHPQEPFHKIAERFGVNPGRISEIANGYLG